MTYSTDGAVAAEVRAEMARQRRGTLWLAQTTGIPRSRLHRRLSGSSAFNTDELQLVATALGLSATELVARSEAAA